MGVLSGHVSLERMDMGGHCGTYSLVDYNEALMALESYGVYLSYYISHETFHGATDLDFTFVGGVNFAAAMLCSPLVNLVTRKMGTNKPMYFGCFLFAAGFVAASFATEFWHLILSQGILVGLGLGFVWLPAAPVLAQWFLRRRSLAQGIASAGSGIGGMTFSLATTPMIQNISLAWSLRIVGIITFVVLLTASILIRDRNATIRPEIRPFDIEILGRYRVLLLVGFTFFSILGYITMLYSLSAFALAIGLSQSQGGIVVAILNLGAAVGRPFVGVLSDQFGRMTVACALTASNVVLCFAIWIPDTSYGLLIFFALLVGATSGIYWGVSRMSLTVTIFTDSLQVIAPLCAEVVDLKELPSTLSLMWLTVSMPALCERQDQTQHLRLAVR